MFPLQCVLCPVDFSDHSRRVLSWAVALAARDRAQLVVASVLEPLLSDAAASLDTLEELQRDAIRRMDEWIDEVIPSTTTPERRPIVVARRGEPDETICEIATQYRANLIVLGTHGLTGLRKLVLGSVTSGVLRRTDTPVLAVPYGAPELLVRGHAGAPVISIDEVLVATDLGPQAMAAAEVGANLAKSFDAKLTLLHVVEGVDPEHAPTAPHVHDNLRSIRAARQLEELADRLASIYRADTRRRFGVPAEQIALAAVEMRASIVVMGLLSAYTLSPRRPGSVAYRVMCLAGVPVLVVPPTPHAPPLVHRETGAETTQV